MEDRVLPLTYGFMMSKAERRKLEKAIGAYFKEIHKIYISGDFREESFYPALKKLIESVHKQ